MAALREPPGGTLHDSRHCYRRARAPKIRLSRLVGVPGFEPGTPCSRSKCATRLRYTPTCGDGTARVEPNLPLPGRLGPRATGKLPLRR